MKDNKMIKYPLILGLVALVAGLLLALVYNVTSPIIEKNANKRENAVIVEIFGENADIENISNTLNNDDTTKGIDNAYVVESKGSEYYVYKITIQDGVGNDNSSALIMLKDGEIHDLKFISIGDDYAKVYSNDSYVSGIVGKDELKDSDVVSNCTATGENVIKSINAAIAHYGRVK